MLDALFSIKPKYVKEIFSGRKKFELRRLPCKKEIAKIIIYETAPISLVVGEVEVVNVIKETPENLWKIVKDASCLSYQEFSIYFKNHDFAYAYELKNPVRYGKSKKLSDYRMKVPPQNFFYIK
ncbi:hypothetical protein [uncultured Treponema sp.]|uniref:hypothetical protein n=1 Tax=uncultured Treponema sp. TaxID=162155 RepID=UPI0025ED05D6|nr:hypothetical protein [uncultured Treponema sp.]